MSETIKTSDNEIDALALLRLCLKKWYVFAIAVGVCCTLTLLYYLQAEPQFKTSATLLLRSQNTTSALSGISIGGFTAADLMGGASDIENEMEIMRTRQLLGQTIEELGMRTITKRQIGWRKIEQYSNSPLLITAPESFGSNMRGSLKVEVKKRSDGTYKLWFKRKVERTTTRHKCETTNLSAVETPWGIFSFTELPENIVIPEEDDGTYHVYFYVASLKSRIEQMQKELTIGATSKKTNAIELSYTSGSPRKNEALINCLIKLYNIGEQIENTTRSNKSATFFAMRMNTTKQELLALEQQIERYKKEHNIADIATQAQITLATSSEYEKQIAATDIEYNLVLFIEEYLQTAKDGDLIPNNTGVSDEALGKMMAQYNELVLKYLRMARSTNATNPIIDQTLVEIRLMRQNILQTIGNLKESLTITKRDLQAKKRTYEKQINQVPALEREYTALLREHEIKQAVYVRLQQQYELALLQESSDIDEMRTIDPAYTFNIPVKPKLKVLLVVSFVLGLFVAGGILYCQEVLFAKKEEEEPSAETAC